ncbi:hypothetical protein [Blastopirellula marina]|uniref:Uncharacterized protein n=1 Tax=Blastopirellula marina TaxID=124 RepID=A0A2S8FM45_9BACT|nr:hypothetical protein [Blastopirellula marina]PQO33110.1 hypothetical protein C5Y98_18430 [Blastopirellula marina]PTL43277.1 hypothetical protein C5Y97_18440 [Blastopirellula marina]
MTFIPFPDLAVPSASGRFRVEIRGQGNGHHDIFRDQSGFRYQLFDAREERLLWTWKPDDSQPLADYPHEAWVDDRGWVVVRLHNWMQGGLLVLSPAGDWQFLQVIQSFGQGEPGFLEEEPDAHIGWTSAGPDWYDSSLAFFLPGESLWIMRTWWGRRLVIDLPSGTLLEEPSVGQMEEIVPGEAAWIRSELERTAGQFHSTEDKEDRWWQDIYNKANAAAYHAGILKVKEAIPRLRELESSPVYSRYGSGYFDLRLRFVAKVSLLRMGEQPCWYANHKLNLIREQKEIELPDIAPNRSPDVFQKGMEMAELLLLVGMPEEMIDGWDYWFTGPGEPFKIRIQWETDAKQPPRFTDYRQQNPLFVASIERIPGAPWAIDPTHEHRIAR